MPQKENPVGTAAILDLFAISLKPQGVKTQRELFVIFQEKNVGN